MLYSNTVEPETLKLLRELQALRAEEEAFMSDPGGYGKNDLAQAGAVLTDFSLLLNRFYPLQYDILLLHCHFLPLHRHFFLLHCHF